MRPDELNNDTEQLPPGWTPETDADAEWDALVRLLRQADRPQMPPRAAFEAARVRIRAELARDRREAPQPTREDSFVVWVRDLLTRGGPGAQALRLAAAAALGFVLATSLLEPPATTQPAASPPAVSAPDIEVALNDTAIHAAPPLPETTAQLSHMQPVSASGGPVMRTAAATTIDRSGIDETGRLKTNGRLEPDLGLASPAGSSWYLYSHYGAMQPVAAQSAAQPLDLLNQLRFHTLTTNDTVALETVRRLEETLTPMLVDERLATARQGRALELLREGEELAARGFPADAKASLQEVRLLVPQSFLAFLAEYQTARLNFEELQNYEEALKSYRAALEDYPAHYLNAQQKSQILERVDLLARNYPQDWKAVRLWQEAMAASDDRQVEMLVSLVGEVPDAPLAVEASRRLVVLGAAPQPGDPEAAERLVALFDAALARPTTAPHAAKLQYAKAEIVSRRLLDAARAVDEYRKVLELPGSAELAPRVSMRLQQLRVATTR